MPFYSWKFDVDPKQTIEETREVEGSAIVYLAVKFPPGPHGLLKVSIFYGLRQIYPDKASDPFMGDDETLESYDEWELPETPCKLVVKATNDDDENEHCFFLRMRTSPEVIKPAIKMRYLDYGMVELVI